MTVASVGPYVLTTRRCGVHQRLINPGGHASPPRMSSRTVGMSASIISSRVGTRESRAGVNHLARAGHQRRPGVERQPDFLYRCIERYGETLINTVLRLDHKNLRLRAHEMASAAMLDLNALWFARRAGSVNDVAKVVWRNSLVARVFD